MESTKPCCQGGKCTCVGDCGCGDNCKCTDCGNSKTQASAGKPCVNPDCTCAPGTCGCGDGCVCGKPLTQHAQKGSNIKTAQVRKPAPYFEADAYYNGFKHIKSTDYEDKYLVLFFYPLDFTFVCPTEIIAFGDKAKEFRAIGAEVVGVSIDSKFTHMEYCKKDRKKGGLGKMEIPLLSDLT